MHVGEQSIGEARRIVSYCGVMLVTAGLLLIVGQVIWPDPFALLVKKLELLGLQRLGLQTNVPGFGIIVVGAVLLLATILRVPKVVIGRD
jgi:hypothetical protein